MWKLNHLKFILFLMIVDLLVYYGDEQLLQYLGYPVNSNEEKILDNFTLVILLILFSFAFVIANKSLNQQLQQSQVDLQQSKEELQLIFDNISATIWSHDLIHNRQFVSAEIKKLFGLSPKEVVNNLEYYKAFIHPEDIALYTENQREMLTVGDQMSHRYRIIDVDGIIRWVEETVTPIKNDAGEITRLNGIIVDITNQIQAEKKIHHMAYHDALTGLPNRYMLNEYLQVSLDRCHCFNKELAIMFLDLDRFKFINDTKGHDFGDILLKKVTERLTKNVREQDIIARQGGDEFIILFENINQSEITEVAQRIVDSFSEPFIINNEEIFTSSSIGISLYPQDGNDSETLIKNADIALYLAKKRGKNGYYFFIREPEDLLNRKVKLENGLRKALDNQEFILYYQPQVELGTGELKGVEALLRWKHPEFGLVSPIEFIPIAEETGFIVTLGKWVLDTACKQSRIWQEKGLPPTRVSVNVSVIQFQDHNFVHTVEQILHKHQLAPDLLELEITESVMQNIKESSDILHQLKQLGVKTAIDDFGTGYSSLNVLNQLPIDFVKIDKTFVNDIGINSNTNSIVKTMIDIGLNLKFELIAEGIEHEIQADFLNQSGCRFGQGYLYSPPLPPEELEGFFGRIGLSA